MKKQSAILYIILVVILFVASWGTAPDNISTALAETTSIPPQTGFPKILGGARIRGSSVALGAVNDDGIDDIVVGGSDGVIHAYRGNGVKLWQYDTGNMSIEGKAAIGDINQDGKNEVVIGAGSTFTTAAHGGLYVLNHLGQLQCSFQPGDFNNNGWRDGIYSSPALADIDRNDGGKLEIVFGGWDGFFHLLNHDCTAVWKVNNYDSVWSSPAIADMDRDGYLDIVIGADSNDVPQYNMIKGGRINALDRFGNMLPGFPKFIDEVIFSSPALGDLTGDSEADVLVGTGYFWANPACNHPDGCTPGVGKYVNGWDKNGDPLPGWPVALNGYTWASPALADLDNDGELEVIINSSDSKVHALNADGSYVPGWPVTPVTPGGVSLATIASPIVADVDGDDNLEVLLVSNWEVVAWDKDGNQLTRSDYGSPAWNLGTAFSLNSSPAVGDVDGDGDVEVVVGGANSGGGSGMLYAWDFSGSAGGKLPWPAFRRDALNHALSPLPAYLDVAPQATTVLHAQSDSSPVEVPLQISNLGSGTINWIVSSGNTAVTAVPNSGSVSVTTGSTVSIDVSGLGLGSHTYTVTTTGTTDGKTAGNSPATTQITVKIVDTVHTNFLPMIERR